MRGAVVVLIGVLFIACGRFSDAPESATDGGIDAATDSSSAADADAGCPAESCVGREQCESWNFDDCKGWATSGDATATCKNGKLLIVAEGTLDAQAILTLPTPPSVYTLRVAGRIVVNRWDGGRALAFVVAQTAIGVVNARSTTLGNKIELELCDGNACLGRKLVVDPGSEHQFLLEVSSAQTKLTVDCVPFATLGGSALPTNSTFSLAFGRVDGNPIDGTLDDVVVSYE